jgi:hypothetical protein
MPGTRIGHLIKFIYPHGSRFERRFSLLAKPWSGGGGCKVIVQAKRTLRSN